MSNFDPVMNLEYYGAQWQRVDLHLHSSASFSMTLPNGMDREKDHDDLVIQYVQRLVKQNIRIAAITDYQGIRPAWFKDIQKAARQEHITVFPGAELSFAGPKYGLHVLAVFPLECEAENINRVIHSLDENPQEPLLNKDGTHRDIRPKESIEQALNHLRNSTKCLFVAAHPKDDNGFLKSFRAQDASQWLASVQPDAVEAFPDKEKQKLLSAGVLTKAELDRIALVEFSDPKSFEEIGNKNRLDGTPRATYMKLSVTDDLQALRLAFHDPQILVSVGEKPQYGYTHLLGFEVEGSGFLGGLKLAFSPELNVFVGGRGVGKSAILETIRYILNVSPFSPGEYRENLIQYALGSGGKAHLFIEQVINPNVRRRYRLERVWGEDTRIFELDNPEREVPLTPSDLLGDQEGPIYFGQREIYDVTRQDAQRLKLLDEIVGRQARAQMQQVYKIETQLRDNTRSILEKRRKLLERQEIEQRLKENRHKIEIYRRQGLVEKLRQATELSSDEQRLIQVMGILVEYVLEWRSVSENWSAHWEFPLQILASTESSQKAYLHEANQVIQQLQNQMTEISLLGQQHLEAAEQQMKNIYARWQDARRPLDEEIQKIKQKLGTQSLDPDELIRLTNEQTNLEPLLKILESTKQGLDRLEEERRLLLNKLRKARHKVWEIRNEQAKEITRRLEKRVDVKVEYKGQRDGFVERLANFFRGSGIDRKSLERLVTANPPVDGITIADKACAGANILETEFDLTPSRSQQIYDFLKADEARLFELQLLSPDDDVQVSLKLDQKYQPLSKLSDGQRATAMLLLLLVQEERLLIVDQPEDDLDNRFIYEDIVRILREQKGKRQLLAATHNPNIPVLGHAELIVALEASSEHTRIEAEGAIDQRKVQEFVRNVMEGGEDAFRRRAQKYGWI